jgi:hypothetical protein
VVLVGTFGGRKGGFLLVGTLKPAEGCLLLQNSLGEVVLFDEDISEQLVIVPLGEI